MPGKPDTRDSALSRGRSSEPADRRPQGTTRRSPASIEPEGAVEHLPVADGLSRPSRWRGSARPSPFRPDICPRRHPSAARVAAPPTGRDRGERPAARRRRANLSPKGRIQFGIASRREGCLASPTRGTRWPPHRAAGFGARRAAPRDYQAQSLRRLVEGASARIPLSGPSARTRRCRGTPAGRRDRSPPVRSWL